jgi:hypothetical protein
MECPRKQRTEHAVAKERKTTSQFSLSTASDISKKGQTATNNVGDLHRDK